MALCKCCYYYYYYYVLTQLLPVSRVSTQHPLLEPADFVTSFKLLHATDSRAAMLNGNYFPIVYLSERCVLFRPQICINILQMPYLLFMPYHIL